MASRRLYFHSLALCSIACCCWSSSSSRARESPLAAKPRTRHFVVRDNKKKKKKKAHSIDETTTTGREKSGKWDHFDTRCQSQRQAVSQWERGLRRPFSPSRSPAADQETEERLTQEMDERGKRIPTSKSPHPLSSSSASTVSVRLTVCLSLRSREFPSDLL